TYRKVISEVLADTPGIEVVGTAVNGKTALQKIEQLHPDLLTLDLEMPEMDGLEVLRRLQADNSPVGAIMLSAFTTQGADATVAALKLGAFDFVVKPSGTSLDESADILRRELCPKIEAFARTRSVRKILSKRTPPASAPSRAMPAPSNVARRLRSIATAVGGKPEVVALGISTGGPQALAKMMPQLPADLAVPMLIVQHMPPMFTKSLADSLNEKCALSVSEAQDKQQVEAGHALIAPGGRQMKIERSAGELRVRITDDPPENNCRPAVDYLFRSVSHVCGSRAVGVIMTGMGNDGTLGCRLMKRRGASIITQNEATCVVYGMPRPPAEEGLADVVAPLDRIAAEIARLAGRGALACK
ncbi:MAG: chemotaxis response regulator protein-glutamate methylesterase, partial [Phycisphaerae bacterium]|nr:chemotaxis response regulator protein-glutamate methylesterase [Phycisphaerae bacterium]